MTATMPTLNESTDCIGTDAFRELFRAVPSAVSVVATRRSGRIHATTVGTVCALSAEPALLMLALNNTSALLAHMRHTGRFGVSVLAHHQQDIALCCAAKGDDKVQPELWAPASDDPRLLDAVAWCACRAENFIDGGDHVIVIGRIVASDQSVTGTVSPLLYHHRQFHSLGAAHA